MKKAVCVRIIAFLLMFALVGCGAESVKTDTTTPADDLSTEQKNAIAMLNYLALITEQIRTTSNSRLLLEDIYTSLLNEINPGSIDETTQEHLNNLRNTVTDLLNIEAKRERLQYVYNHEKAMAIRNAIPNLYEVKFAKDGVSWKDLLKAINWQGLVMATSLKAIDAYMNYRTEMDSIEHEYFLSGWDLDQEGYNLISENRDNTFNYMTDIVQEYGEEGSKEHLGSLTLNEKAIEDFAEICSIDEVHRRVERLTYAEETYQMFGNYWLELADCYYELEEYEKCLECVDKYFALNISIFRKDFNIVPVLPKAIVAAQMVYSGEEAVSKIKFFADTIIANVNSDEWSARFFAAQAYMDLFDRTDNEEYLKTAYDVILHNVSELVDEQIALNEIYMNGVQKITIDDRSAKRMSDEQKKQEQKRIEAYNESIEEKRETELPPLYEPLFLNCELLFALAEKLDVDDAERTRISNLLQTETGGVFLSAPINSNFAFGDIEVACDVTLSDDEVAIPANLLLQGATVVATVVNGTETTTLDDLEISEVARKGSTVDSFVVYWESEKLEDYKWSADTVITFTITNDNHCDPISVSFKVAEFEENWIFSDTVVFERIYQ